MSAVLPSLRASRHRRRVHTLVDAASQGDGLSRRAVLSAAALSGGAAIVGGIGVDALRGGSGSPVGTAVAGPDAGLRFVLLVETLQAALYARAVERTGLDGELREFAEVVAEQERAHVAYVGRRLGAVPALPAVDVAAATASPRAFALSAQRLEDLGVSAMLGATVGLDDEGLAVASRLLSVEARHAAWIRDLLGMPPAPEAVEAALAPEAAMQRLRQDGLIA